MTGKKITLISTFTSYISALASTGSYTINLPSDYAVYNTSANSIARNLSAIGFGTGFSNTISTGYLMTIAGTEGIMNNLTTFDHYSYTQAAYTEIRLSSTPRRTLSGSTSVCGPGTYTLSTSESYNFTLHTAGTFLMSYFSPSTTLSVQLSVNTNISLSYRPAFPATATSDMLITSDNRKKVLQPSDGKLLTQVVTFDPSMVTTAGPITSNSIIVANTFTANQLENVSFGYKAFDSAFQSISATISSILSRPFRVLYLDSDSSDNGLYIISGNVQWAGNSSSNNFHGITSTTRRTLLKGSPSNAIAFADIVFI